MLDFGKVYKANFLLQFEEQVFQIHISWNNLTTPTHHSWVELEREVSLAPSQYYCQIDIFYSVKLKLFPA